MIAVYIFYNVSGGIQSRLAFSEEFQHCSTVIYDGRDWLSLELLSDGLEMRKISCKDSKQLFRALRGVKTVTAIVACDVDDRKEMAWKPWWVRTCNEVCRYNAGTDIGFTFNPRHLYKKLLKYNSRTNYEILYAWRRQNGHL